MCLLIVYSCCVGYIDSLSLNQGFLLSENNELTIVSHLKIVRTVLFIK